jgi:hypothetical protein
MAAAGGMPASTALASAAQTAAPMDNAAFLSSFPVTATPAPVTMASNTTSASAPTMPVFRSLFQAGERSQPVSPAIQELWGNSSSMTSTTASASSATVASAVPATSVSAPQGLDLFSDRNGTFSS